MPSAVKRIRRIQETADRYETNIVNKAAKTKVYQDTSNQIEEARRINDMKAFRKAYKANSKVLNKAYSRSTYMGMSNG